jgi:acetyltransferase-like isoleucine patch superfamily enzyme
MTARIIANSRQIAADVRIGDAVEMIADRIVIEPGVSIENEVSLRARNIHIGYKAAIQRRCTLKAIGGDAERIHLGDYSLIANDTTILVPEFVIGDYTAVHNHVLINGYKPCTIGHNSFIGQHSVLNSSETLTIGNNFRMALNGYVWTHAESGELLEGCNFYHRTPTIIEDDVWLAGCNISISPGVRLAQGTIILMGSVVTKNTLPRRCYGGSPARDLTEQMKPYREVTHREKIAMMKGFVAEFLESRGAIDARAIGVLPDGSHPLPSLETQIVILENGPTKSFGDRVSVFSLETKTYVKRRIEIEEQFMRFLVGARARFLPVHV